MAAAVAPVTDVRVLVVSSSWEDYERLRTILLDRVWQLEHATNAQQASALLEQRPYSIVVVDCQLEDGSWREVLDITQASFGKPPLVVASTTADDYLWSEVLNLGGYNVLAKPFDREEVRWVLEHAYQDRQRRLGSNATAA